MDFLKRLPKPQEVLLKYPLNKEYEKRKKIRDEEIQNILEGKLDKFVMIIGPCSADREDAVLDYARRLSGLQEKVQDCICIIPRIYTSKARTIGTSYKGLLHQPFPNRGEDIVEGILAVRRLHTTVIEETGLFCADKMLYPEIIRYISDLLSYIVIGARSVENQQHRLTASGLTIPVGIKNPMSGDISVMLNAIITAHHPHHFIFNEWEVISRGNAYAHGVLRGYIDPEGKAAPNYHYEDLRKICSLYKSKKIENMSLIVDCSHGNSNKNYLEQINVAFSVLNSMKKDADIAKFIKGLMIESYIEDGCQSINGNMYGKSITDPCLGWEKTEKLVYDLADSLKG